MSVPLRLRTGRSRLTVPDPRLKELDLDNLLGNPVETTVAAAQLVFVGVLTRHPGLRVMLVQGGGCLLPDLVPRSDHGVRTRTPELGDLPSEAVRWRSVDCLVHHAGPLDRAVEVFEEDRMGLGSDWPFPMGIYDPVALVAHREERCVHRAACDNAAAALRPDAPE